MYPSAAASSAAFAGGAGEAGRGGRARPQTRTSRKSADRACGPAGGPEARGLCARAGSDTPGGVSRRRSLAGWAEEAEAARGPRGSSRFKCQQTFFSWRGRSWRSWEKTAALWLRRTLSASRCGAGRGDGRECGERGSDAMRGVQPWVRPGWQWRGSAQLGELTQCKLVHCTRSAATALCCCLRAASWHVGKGGRRGRRRLHKFFATP